MSDLAGPRPASVRLALGWARLYTRGLPAILADDRINELESDLWEHLHDADTSSREILGRILRGIHADVWWRYRTLLDARGARQGSHDMQTTSRRDWWTPVTAVAGLGFAAMGLMGVMLGGPDDGGTPGVVLAGIAAIGGALMLFGLSTRRQHVVRGSRLIVAGAILCSGNPMFIPLAVLVLVGGFWSGNLALTTAKAAAVQLEPVRRSITSTWYRWLISAAALAGLGFATLVVWENSGLVPENCTETDPCWEDSAAWAVWILSWMTAMVTGAIGTILGVARFFTRHHMRPA